MKIVRVDSLTISDKGELFIHPSLPDGEGFSFIYRSASGIHWNEEAQSLYCPAPREWSYAQWFEHAVTAVASEYGCQLVLAESTKWGRIPDEVRVEIETIHGGKAT